MTLPLNSRLSALYDTNGTQKDFGFGFRVFFDPDNGGYGLEVRRQIAGGYEVIPKSDYLVLPVEDNSSGVVRFNVAPSAGQQIYIAGKTPTIQQLVLTNFGRYSAESIETQFDFITAIIQEWISGLDEETRQRIENDQLLKQHIEQRINDFIAVVDSRFEGKWLEISEYLDTLLPMFFNIMREEIEAFTNEQLPAIINQRLSEVIDAEMDAYLDDLSHQVSQNIEAINEAAANATAAESAKNEAIVAKNQIVSEVGETKNYLDEALSQLSTAASKYYSTLAEANYYIAYMGVNELVYVGNYDGAEGLYYKASPEATNLTKSAYDPLTQAKVYTDTKVAKVPIGRNLVDPSQIINLCTVDSNGVPIPSSGLKLTGFIPAKPNAIYSKAAANGMWAEYDINKQFVKFYGSNVANKIVTQPTTAFIRTSFLSSAMASVNQSAVHVYEDYSERNIIPNQAIDPISAKTAISSETPNKLDSDITVTASQVDFLTRSSPNLFDSQRDMANTQLQLINHEGVDYASYVPSQFYYTSHLIPVTPNTIYTTSAYNKWVQFDSNLNVVASQNTAFGIKTNITTVADAAYLQLGIAYSSRIPTEFTLTLATEWPSGYPGYGDGILYNRYVENTQIIKYDEQQWVGKKFIWMGTSVPAGGGYPEATAKNLLATVDNKSKGGGRIGAFKQGNIWDSQNNLINNFTLAKSDINNRYGSMLGKTVRSSDYLIEDAGGVVLTQAMLDALTADNYETRLTPNIASADVFFIDYGMNDRNLISTYPVKTCEELAASNKLFDRSEFAGAMSFLIKHIIDEKKAANVKTYTIVIVSYFSRYARTDANHIVKAQQNIASYWGLPFINLADNMGVNSENIAQLTSDGIHFNEGTGPLSKRISKFITAKMKELNV